MNRRGNVLLLLAGALLLLAAPALAQDGDAGAGDLVGTVVHGVDGVGIGDLEVRLVTVSEGEQTELERTTTDAEGAFAFPAVPHGPEIEVVTRFDDATYRSGPLRSMPAETTAVALSVFDATDDPAAVRIASWVVWLDRDAGVSVQQDLQIVNDASLTWLGADPEPDGTRAVLTVPLHPQATGFGFLGRFAECCATMRGAAYVHTTPLPPGQTNATLRYVVEDLEELTLPVPLPVDSFTVMLPDGVAIAGTPLEQAGQLDSRGVTYTMFGTGGLEPGDVLTLELRGLGPEQTAWWRYAAAAGLAVVVVAIAIVVLRGRRSSTPAYEGRTAPASRQETGRGVDDIASRMSEPVAAPLIAHAGGPVDSSGADPAAASVLEPDLLLEELALLDEGFERGLLSPEAYEPLRAARLEELRRSRIPARGG
ncbi:MAG: hypothetical protein ACNA8R_03640 [Nitriliruptoraceae bacterium]